MSDEYEFEVKCQVCGETTWIYGDKEMQDQMENEGYTCLECKENTHQEVRTPQAR